MFDGLIPKEHDLAVRRLLFLCAHWHGLAKLRMHTDATLDILDGLTTKIGAAFRNFTDDICPKFATRELAREHQARKRKEAKRSSGRGVVNNAGDGSSTHLPQPQMLRKGPALSESTGSTDPSASAGTKGPRDPEQKPGFKGKTYNMNTYKHHSLGDYVKHIREYGTTDSYSTETVSSLLCIGDRK